MSFQLYTTEAIDEVEARSMNTVSTIIMQGLRVDLLISFKSIMEKLVERMRAGSVLLLFWCD